MTRGASERRYSRDRVTLPAPVLVVDDDAVSRHVLVAALQSAGLPSATVSSGAEALTWCETTTPSLVLLDLVMPPPDGYDVLRVLRSREATKEIPIVVLTALGADEEISRAFDEGADDFLRKPFRPVELVARIRGQRRVRDYVDQIAAKERDAAVLLELTQALASTLDTREILQGVVKRVAEVTRVDRASIVMTQAPGEVGFVVASNDDQAVHDLPLDLGKYPEIRASLASGAPLVIHDSSTHPLFEVLRETGMAFTSLAIVPIVDEGRPLGVLFLRSREKTNLDEHVISLARTVANTTAIALRNAQVLKDLKEKTEESTYARFEAERRLRLTQRYADFFESAADGIILLDNAGLVLFTNPRAREVLGYSTEEMHGRRLRDLVAEDSRADEERLRRGFADGKYPQGVDLFIVTKSGRLVTVSANFSVMRAENAVLATIRDVTLDRAMQGELRATKGFLERVIDSSVDAIISADLRGTVLLFNRAAERCYGYTSDEVVGRMSTRDLYAPGVAKQIMQLVRDGAGRLESFRTEVVTKEGELVPVSLSAALIMEDRRPVGSVGIFTDLRERVRMETRLAAAQEELKVREKQALVAELAGAAAHELNQPLTSVMGYAELLKRRLDTETPAFAAAEVILNEAERMAEIVRKIGKITRYETKSYVGHAKILDLDRASDDAPPASVKVGSPPEGANR